MSHVDRLKKLRKDAPYPPAQQKPVPESQEVVHGTELPHLVKGLKPYRAVERFRSGENTDRFRIIDAAGNIDFYSYSHLLEGSYRNGMLTLVTTTRSFVLSGRNLDQIIDLVTEQKAKALCAFAEGLHEPVGDTNDIFIEGIARE